MDLRKLVASFRGPALSTADGIVRHYRAFWGADRVMDIHWTPEHLGSRLPDFHIAKVRPAADGMWTYATIGAWQATAQEHHGLEFIAVSASDDPAVMQSLGMIAYYHAGPPENRLGLGHTIPIGEAWVEGSTLESILICLPYLWGPKLEHCLLTDRHIQVLWALPITSAEQAFRHEHGVDALEQRFEDAQINYLDPARKSVV
jgi:hypothetical protein